MFENKTLLITGGTGSFGNAVLERFINTEVKEIRIFSRDEKKQEDMRVKLKNNKVKFYIGDVRDYESIDSAFPSCEFYPMQAVKTNILGMENVLNAALNNKVKKVIVLSTDKAVYPISVMGISKAMMEKLMIAKSRDADKNKTILCGTRYGNVIASRGSVIPLFINQIKSGQPLTITDPKMTRFMMSINSAVDLVLYAFKHGKQGDMFVKKSPACTIGDLALAIKELFKAKNEIKIIGTRHGEKLYETLLTREEMAKAEDCGNYFRILADTRDLNYNKFFIEGEPEVSVKEDYNSHNTKRLNVKEIKKILLKIDYIQAELGK